MCNAHDFHLIPNLKILKYILDQNSKAFLYHEVFLASEILEKIYDKTFRCNVMAMTQKSSVPKSLDKVFAPFFRAL